MSRTFYLFIFILFEGITCHFILAGKWLQDGARVGMFKGENQYYKQLFFMSLSFLPSVFYPNSYIYHCLCLFKILNILLINSHLNLHVDACMYTHINIRTLYTW